MIAPARLSVALGRGVLIAALALAVADAQVHYDKDGRPWKQRADGGPDAVVDGWYYNLGITGLRVQLMADAPEHLLVKHVFEDSPASGKIRVGDVLIGAGGQPFATPHRNGYGMDKFGAHGPIRDVADALEAAQVKGKGRLALTVTRAQKRLEVDMQLGAKAGTFADGFPEDCAHSARVLTELCEYLLAHQRADGSWGSPPHDTFAPLALLATGKAEYRDAVRRNVKMHARTTSATDDSWLINWRYMAAAIVMSEYYLATGEKWVVPELEEVHAFLMSSQYTDLGQVHPKTKVDRPRDLPKNAEDSHGGWGHNPGFEGYGPICMLTGQGAAALALMKHCGIRVDRTRHDAAYAFLERGTGKNGYVWYEDEPAGQNDWADMGRTGAAGLANLLSPYAGERYKERALAHARVIGGHPESFPDTHGSPIMGMAYAALAAFADADAFRRLMDANRSWFTLARCRDGSFYYQPNRDNAGYGADSRISATAAVALILAIPKRSLHVTGKPFKK